MTPPVALELPLRGSPYEGYAYSYPHKTSHRVLDPPVSLREVWERERKTALSLYYHVPFCEHRCGYCNLFAIATEEADLRERYLRTLVRQSSIVRSTLASASVARLAIGGGTPTALNVGQLERVLVAAQEFMSAPISAVPTSVETSPATATADHLGLLRAFEVHRVSIGIQSFVEREALMAGRRQRTAQVDAALDRIRAIGIPVLNIDLIYGLPGQSTQTWLHSVRRAARWRAEEIYLYPLYIRPATALATAFSSAPDLRLTLYRRARDLLRSEGYEQVSMRLFRSAKAPVAAGPVYSCQTDGMIGLGCGARSYTRRLHYSDPYAVTATGVRAILRSYIARTDTELAQASHGVELDAEDQRRRFVILSLLADGLDLRAYGSTFGSSPFEDIVELTTLEKAGLAKRSRSTLCLTDAGVEQSDLIGPRLYSRRVRSRMEAYRLR